ncbi:MAG TPA: hypothetical protein VGS41_16450, partial [Chthonomonadales bacterium]|nr:hypothetical protein [Chthonomonadales bacterium]
MPTAIWGESEPRSDDVYPLSLLKQLLAQMMERFSAQGACLALYDEHTRQMVIRLHRHAPSAASAQMEIAPGATGSDIDQIDTIPIVRRKTAGLSSPATPISGTGRMRRLTRPLSSLDRLSDSSPAALFPLGEAYGPGQGLIGITWRKGEPLSFPREELALPTGGQGGNVDALPTWYLSLPIQGPLLPTMPASPVPATSPMPPENQPGSQAGQREHSGQSGQPPFQALGVIVLYQYAPAQGFDQQQIEEALQYAERIGLYIQNDHLRRAQADMYNYIQRLQQISTVFPSNVLLSRLVEDVYRFVMAVVPASSVLMTLFDRDTKKLYDVFAVDHGQPITGLADHPVVADPALRPVWQRIAEKEQHTLLLSTSEED